MTGIISAPVPHLSHALLRELYFRLRGAGYIATMDMLRAGQTQEDSPISGALHFLKRLFVTGDTLKLKDVTSVLTPFDLYPLADAGLLEHNAEQIRALFQIQVYDNLLFITDFMPRDHAIDLVLPIGPSGKYLANATIREPVESALDLGTGCGIQALLMARHARHVTATDINPRALALTRLNATLNGFTNIEVLEGSYFKPIQGRTFDLVAANLPYVLTPESKYVYRDLGQDGETRIQQTVDDLPSHLNEDGYAHIMLNWTHRADQPWWQPIEEWTANRNVDAWALYSKSESPEEYVKTWLLVNEAEAPYEYKRIKDQWLGWFKSQNTEQIASGLMTLRRRTEGKNWRCSVYVSKVAREPLGAYIKHLFQSQDYLAQISDPRDLLVIKLRPWNILVEESATGSFTARTMRGFLIQSRIQSTTAAVINQLDGKISLRNAIQQSLKDGADFENQSEITAKEIYHLMNFGMIVIAE